MTTLRSTCVIAIATLVVSALGTLAIARDAKSRAKDADVDNPVLAAARAFPDGGAYNEKWAGSGTPEEVRHKGERILSKGEGGTYCCGFTFAVVMRVAAAHKLLDAKSPAEVKRFQKEWYGAVDDKDIRERQCAVAVEHIGIGKTIPFDEAQPGDFCQFWRGKGGHSVVFLNWVEKDGKRIGIHYRSSQGSTKGIGDRTEYFSDSTDPDGKPGKVVRERTYFGRLNR